MEKLVKMWIFVIPILSFGWDGVKTGVIQQIDITGNNNYDLRIRLGGVSSMCGNSNNWAFLNHTDNNYDGYMSALLTAKAMGVRVKIYTNQTSSNGYCHIGYVTIY